MEDKYWHQKLVASRLKEHAQTVNGVLVKQDIKQGATTIEQLIEELQKRDKKQ